jgi:YegS/Rv2252/BmrU family lipid kinase
MRKAALLYYPESGGSKRRERDLRAAVEILRAGQVEAELVATTSKEHAAEKAKSAIEAGCDTIFACGGDGTVHNMVQVLANTPVALGVFPIGTANALAHDLGWPFRIPAAAKAALNARPRRVAVGRVTCHGLQGAPTTCHFVVAAGIGLDAHLFYKLQSGVKQRLGMAAYYAKAWHLWFSYAMTRFRVEYMQTSTSTPKVVNVTELLAVRIRNFGGVLRELAPGASLDRDDVRLVFCHTASRLAYLSYVTAGLFRLAWPIPGIELSFAVKASCDYGADGTDGKVYVEADGELIGSLPAEISVVPDALTLLTPVR